MDSTADLDLGGAAATLPVGALLACALVAAVLGIGGWSWCWLTTASTRGAPWFAGRAAVFGGASALTIVTMCSWLGAATVPVLLAVYLVVGVGFWLVRAGR
jgi:hypothetical protein